MAKPAPFLMPKLGLTMTEGMIAEWRIEAGQAFRAGDVVVVVETEKIANEIEAPADGRLDEIVVGEGETVAVGATIARWSLAGGGTSRAAEPPAPARQGRRIQSTPLARRLARERGIDLALVTASGPRGRIKAADVETAAAEASSRRRTVPAAAAPTQRHRRAVARRLAEVKPGVPHFYLASEVRAEKLAELRRQLNEPGDRPRLSLTHLIVAAAARALIDVPEAHQVWRNDALVGFDGVDIALAVDTAHGLAVPVLRDLGRGDPYDVLAKAEPLIKRAREGRLTADDVGGGSLTVSNAGMHDVTYMASIITPGQSSILGVGAMRQLFRPDAQGRPAPVSEIGLVLSCDHRVFDGVLGLRLLRRIKAYLENPARLLMPRPPPARDD